MTRQRCSEAGSATTWSMPAFAALAVVTLLLAHLGALVVERRHAESAADLAALAGAAAVQRGADGCAAARHVAGRNDADLAACTVRGLEVRLRMARSVAVPLVGPVVVQARARAGPAGDRISPAGPTPWWAAARHPARRAWR